MNAPCKVCSKCGTEKPIDEFGDKNAAKDGKNSRCRLCLRDDSRSYEIRNREKRRERNRIRMNKWYNSLSKAEKSELYKKGKKWVENNPERNRETKNKWASNNKAKIAESQRRLISNLSACYIRGQLSSRNTLTASDIPDELVNAKREHIKLIRKLKEYKNGTHSKTTQAN